MRRQYVCVDQKLGEVVTPYAWIIYSSRVYVVTCLWTSSLQLGLPVQNLPTDSWHSGEGGRDGYTDWIATWSNSNIY